MESQVSQYDVAAELLNCDIVAHEPRQYERMVEAYKTGRLQAAVGRGTPRKTEGRVGVVPILGTINHRFHVSGLSCCPMQVADDVSYMASSRSYDYILLDISSPGGGVSALPEAAAAIREAREKKPVVAVANGHAYSAAYWLASQATPGKLFMLGSGGVGSIGVFGTHVHRHSDNITVTMIHNQDSPYKTEGNAYEPLSEETLQHEQKRIEKVFDSFVSDIALGREVSESHARHLMGQGRTIHGREAINRRMIDGIATLREAVTIEARKASNRRRATAARARLNGDEWTTDDDELDVRF